MPLESYTYRWWVRFKVRDVPGVFGKIAGLLGDNEISIREAFQRNECDSSTADSQGRCVRIHLLTEVTNWGRLASALACLDDYPPVVSKIALPILS